MNVIRILTGRWHTIVPPIALVALAFAWGTHPGGLVSLLLGVILAASVLAAVHHAEVVAARVGEPLGSVILALAVTVIEVGLIVMTMTGPKASPLWRATRSSPRS